MAELPKMQRALFILLLICFIPVVLVNLPPFALFGEATPAESGIVARQNGFSWMITPLVGQQQTSDFYSYVNFRTQNTLANASTSLIFLYKEAGDAQGEALNLFIIHGPPAKGTLESTAGFSLWGLPSATSVLVKDDPDDYYDVSPPVGNLSWRWSTGFTDGVVLGDLQAEFTLTIYPRFDAGITQWVLMAGDLENPQYIELSPQDPLVLEARLPDPIASFRFLPVEPLAGEPVSFDASMSRSSAGSIARYRWDFDADGLFEVRLADPITTYTFATPGDHAVTLEVEDSLGHVAAETRSIRVRNGAVRVTRLLRTPLPDLEILRGYSFTVELEIEAELTVNGLGIEEEPPRGWNLRPVDNDGAQFNPETSAWLFLETLAPRDKRRIRYQIEVPAQEQPGIYPFAGRALSGFPQMATEIHGDSEMRVISALSIELAISRLNDQGAIDLTLSNVISFSQILQATALWQEQRPVPGTNGRRIDLSTMVRLVAYWLTDTPVNQSLPSGSS